MNRTYSEYILKDGSTGGNGLRVICWPTEGLVSYIGVVINAGSRDEDPSRHGLAHFVEHTIFKGTSKRRVWQISGHMESVGGELNAYTSKEETMIYTNAPAGYEERGIELLADLICNSLFPREEVEREREVVIEEIHSYLDSPSESVFDEFEELAYEGSGLAHNILGTVEDVKRLSDSDCREFVDRFYSAPEMVVYCCTPQSPERMFRYVEKHFGRLNRKTVARDRVMPPVMKSFDLTRDRGNHQANTIVGPRVFGRRDPRRFALFLLNNYLGGPCMNSRLNRELREKRGLVYAVDSSVSLMSDTGLVMVYFGCDPGANARCKRIISNELDRLCQSTMNGRTLEKIKRQYCGQLLVSSDHRENRAMSLAKSLLYYDDIHDIATTADHIRRVTAEELREVAELLSPALCGSLTLM